MHTIADGIAVKTPGEKTFEYIKKYVDRVVTVSDDEIASAVLLLLERCKQVVETSGAAPLAAVLNNKVDVNGAKRSYACCPAAISTYPLFTRLWKRA